MWCDLFCNASDFSFFSLNLWYISCKQCFIHSHRYTDTYICLLQSDSGSNKKSNTEEIMIWTCFSFGEYSFLLTLFISHTKSKRHPHIRLFASHLMCMTEMLHDIQNIKLHTLTLSVSFILNGVSEQTSCYRSSFCKRCHCLRANLRLSMRVCNFHTFVVCVCACQTFLIVPILLLLFLK